jgi:dual specificity tyrosine-phosphorylation-regulated kinase 2/3/4
MPLNS